MGITILILTEVLQGIRDEGQVLATVSALSEFNIFETGSSELAIQSARNYRLLCGKGVRIRNRIDCMIATFCIEEGHWLLHGDRDFDHFAQHLGLLVVDSPAPLLK